MPLLFLFFCAFVLGFGFALAASAAGARLSRNSRISPHMPPCLAGAPRRMTSAAASVAGVATGASRTPSS